MALSLKKKNYILYEDNVAVKHRRRVRGDKFHNRSIERSKLADSAKKLTKIKGEVCCSFGSENDEQTLNKRSKMVNELHRFLKDIIKIYKFR